MALYPGDSAKGRDSAHGAPPCQGVNRHPPQKGKSDHAANSPGANLFLPGSIDEAAFPAQAYPPLRRGVRTHLLYDLPLFPLPGLVLFPRTHVKLHIFEERYRLMMEHVMATEPRIAVGRLCEGYEADYYEAPRVHRVATAARFLWSDRLADGRWNVCLEGVERVMVEDEPQISPFRVARARPLVDRIPADRHKETVAQMHEVAQTAERLAGRMACPPRGITNLVNTWLHPGIVADVVAAAFVTESYDRQSILEECNVLRRLRLVGVQLQRVESHIEAHGTPPDPTAHD